LVRGCTAAIRRQSALASCQARPSAAKGGQLTGPSDGGRAGNRRRGTCRTDLRTMAATEKRWSGGCSDAV